MANNSQENIEDVKVGDKVISESEDGVKSVSTVTKLDQPVQDEMCQIDYTNGDKLKLTSEHPIFTPQGWKSIDPTKTAQENPALIVGKLSQGDQVKKADDSWDTVANIACWSQRQQTYNLILDNGAHTYFADGFLAHNKSYNCNVLLTSNINDLAVQTYPNDPSTAKFTWSLTEKLQIMKTWLFLSTNQDAANKNCGINVTTLDKTNADYYNACVKLGNPDIPGTTYDRNDYLGEVVESYKLGQRNTDELLSPATKYYWKVVVNNRHCAQGKAGPAFTTPACLATAATHLVVTRLSSTKAKLTWTPGENGNSQQLYGGTNRSKVESGCPDGIGAGTGCVVKETNLGKNLDSYTSGNVLEAGKLYYWKLVGIEPALATSSGCHSGATVTANLRGVCEKPATPCG